MAFCGYMLSCLYCLLFLLSFLGRVRLVRLVRRVREFVRVVLLVDLGGRVLCWALGVCLFLCLGGLRVRLWGL